MTNPHPSQPAARWWRYVNDRQLTCPAGHRIKVSAVLNESGFLFCDTWVNDEGRERDARAAEGTKSGHNCNLAIFVFVIAGGRAITVEVERTEIRAMRDLRTPAAMIDYLGIFEPSALARIAAPSLARPVRAS